MREEIDIADLKAGNAKIFEMLFKQWYEPLCRYAYSMLHNQEEAEDITQKTFCKLWDQREKMEIHTSIKSYLYRMVHNACLNKIKQWQMQSEHHEQIAYSSVSVANHVEQTVAHKELSHQIELAIAALPERCREVFLLSRMQHLSYIEIAQKMQISPNTVETQIVKALKTLRIKLKDYLSIGLFLLLNMIN
ncbi:MAG: RNA polymerase sigma-70 factor [Bacteroidetes bacterium]|nr:RNA polymerase sigma-70 factor [Bacteroidota bacterium]MCL2301671.1 RNA polymerase sigma-70 factor [Lentimicrobiaceae bacterium]